MIYYEMEIYHQGRWERREKSLTLIIPISYYNEAGIFVNGPGGSHPSILGLAQAFTTGLRSVTRICSEISSGDGDQCISGEINGN